MTRIAMTLERTIPIFLLALLAIPQVSAGTGDEVVGTSGEAGLIWYAHPIANEALAEETPVRRRGAGPGTYEIPIAIDLSGVTVDDVPATLGAWIARVDFDPDRIEVMSVGGGSGVHFEKHPVYTQLPRANERGILKLVGYQTDDVNPAGIVEVARIVVQEKRIRGIDSVDVILQSVSSSANAPDTRQPIDRPRIEIQKKGSENQ